MGNSNLQQHQLNKIAKSQEKCLMLRADLYYRLFTQYLKVPYQVNDIAIGGTDSVHTIFVPCMNVNNKQSETFFLSIGLGGSSLMWFPLFKFFLGKGNMVIWQIRGMGLSSTKLDNYQQETPQQIQYFFVSGLEKALTFYNRKSIMVAHSFSSYITFSLIIKRSQMALKYIKQAILFSPIGITPKEDDYKSSLGFFDSVSDGLYYKIVWSLELTGKSVLRCCGCCKQKSIVKKVKQLELNNQQNFIMHHIIEALLQFPDGSESLFYKYFQQKILPKIPLEPLIIQPPVINITMVFGGDEDWTDKTGSIRVAVKFPEKIRKIDILVCGHNIPFHYSECQNILQYLFAS